MKPLSASRRHGQTYAAIGRILMHDLATGADRLFSLPEYLAVLTRAVQRGTGGSTVEMAIRRGDKLYRCRRAAGGRLSPVQLQSGPVMTPPGWPARPAVRLAGGWRLHLRTGTRFDGYCLVTGLPRARSAGTLRDWQNLAEWLTVATAMFWKRLLLRERVKELACHNALAGWSAQRDRPLTRLLPEAVPLIAAAWLHADLAEVAIELDGTRYGGPTPPADALAAPLVINGQERGRLTVSYRSPQLELDEGPFLREERQLLDTVARQLALVISQREADEEQAAVQAQLRHADRLATIGQLAAGVAHELNEPLGAILGFAQLAQRSDATVEQTGRDLQRIVEAAIQARQIIKNLLVFSRQTPADKHQVDLNELISRELTFVEQLAARQQVRLERTLAADLPVLQADPVQLRQVLVNLTVNALQAMPDGGRLLIATSRTATGVTLTVSDTGCGITPEILPRIFDPFFTTKEPGKSTGLGLPVVHGIVTEHGGSITVSSRPRSGSRFIATFPIGSGCRHD